jgi:Glycosyltransferase
MYKIIFINNIPSPYRNIFYNELGKIADVYVLYERRTAADRDKNWNEVYEKNYKAIFIKSIKIGNESSFGISPIQYIKTIKPDFLVISGYSSPTVLFTIYFCRLFKIKYIISMDGAILKKESNIKKYVKTIIISKAIAGLCTGKLSREYLTHYGLTDNNVYTYPFTSQNDADISLAASMLGKKEYYRSKLGINEEVVILSVGRFSYQNGYGKGYDLLIEAIKNISDDVGVYIVGDNPTDEFITIKERYKLDNLHYISFKNKSELAEYYAASDIFILLTRYDVWGLVINEAMSFGLPVITTDMCVAGMELIENEINGYVIPSEDTGAAYDALSTLINDKTLREKMSVNNIKKIKNYSIEKMAASHAVIFENILGKKDSNG